MGHLRSSLSSTKKLAQRSIDQNQAIHDCLLCRDRIKQIEAHHPDEGNIAGAVFKIAKCKTCKPTLQAIITCAKMGHIYPETSQKIGDAQP